MGRSFFKPIIPDISKYSVIAEPIKSEEWYWVGAPSALYDVDSDEFWLAYRVRSKEERGFKLVLAVSKNGVNFNSVKVFYKNDVNLYSFERPSLVKDPFTGRFRLYLSGDVGKGWRIFVLDDVDDPRDFDISTLKIVLSPSSNARDNRSVKDPYVFTVGGLYFMYYIGAGVREEMYGAYSYNGLDWNKFEENPILERGGWHNYYTRPSNILDLDGVFQVFYEGSNKDWYQPVFNIQTGYGISFDLRKIYEVTLDKPLLSSPTGNLYETIRYMDSVIVDDKIYFYYEAARRDNSFELRVSVQKVDL